MYANGRQYGKDWYVAVKNGTPTYNTDKQPSKENFKYVISQTNYKLTVTRYGEDWLGETGSKFLYTLASALLDADAFQTSAKRYFIWRVYGGYMEGICHYSVVSISIEYYLIHSKACY